MVTVSSNINIYSNLSANERISGFVKDNLFIGELPQNSTNINSDKFEKNTYNPNSFTPTKFKQKLKLITKIKQTLTKKHPKKRKK